MSDTIRNQKKGEPESLSRGKQYHKKVQNDWHKTAEGKVEHETEIIKPSGRKGRIDIFVDASDENDKNLSAVIEIKASNWNLMTLEAVKRNIRRQAKQIWDYVESQLEQGKDVSPGVIFPERPEDTERLKMIEKLFEERGIPVVWEDESIEERKARS